MEIVLVVLGAVALMLLRVPIAVALLVPSSIYVAIDPSLSASIIMQRMVSGVNSFPLLAVPVFILAGNVANETGVTERLFTWAEALIGHVRGSLGYVNVLASFAFSWMSGAALSDAAVLGKLAVPEMVRRGYSPRFSVGITGASSMISPVMPPSIPAVIYGVSSGVSIGALFIAGIVPALVLMLVLVASCFTYARKKDLRGTRATPAEMRRATLGALPILFAPVIVLGGILGGVFTPTEAASAVVAYLLLLALIRRNLSFGGFGNVLLATARTSASVMFIVAAMSLFGLLIVRDQVPQRLAAVIGTATTEVWVFLLLVNLFLLLLGMFIEPVSAILLATPILLPVAEQFGVDPLHFGIVMILNLLIGLITPPVGLLLYVLSSVTDIPVAEVIRGSLPFLAPLLLGLLVITFLPEMTLALPRAVGLVP